MPGLNIFGSWVLGLSFLLAGGAKAETPITLQLDWKANAQFAGPLVAKEAGWYREAGLDVTFVRPMSIRIRGRSRQSPGLDRCR